MKPEMRKAGMAVRLKPPPSLAGSPVIRGAGEAADETFAEARDEEQKILHAVSSDSRQGWCQQPETLSADFLFLAGLQ